MTIEEAIENATKNYLTEFEYIFGLKKFGKYYSAFNEDNNGTIILPIVVPNDKEPDILELEKEREKLKYYEENYNYKATMLYLYFDETFTLIKYQPISV